MQRDLARLASEEFDVVVIGGGVYGLTVAVELTGRGLSVAILERDDFAGATSFNSLKTVHGGIRALQHGAFAEARAFVRERRAFALAAPHLVRPLPFIVPTYRHPIRNRAAMALFLAFYDRFAADRNIGVDRSLALPPSRTVSRRECLSLNPAIDPAGVTGGAIWHDYQLHAPERFALALLRSAEGAAAANYARVTSLLVGNGRIGGVRVHDALSASTFDVRGRAVVNAAGPGAWHLLQQAGAAVSAPPPRFSLAMNIVVNREPRSHAAGGMADGRFLFMVPWRDCSIIGTSHDAYSGPSDRIGAIGEHLHALLADVQSAFPGAGILAGDIRLVHRGLLPAAVTGSPDSLLKQSIVHDHGRDGIEGLLTVVGVRYTTARATARQAAERVASLLGRLAPPPDPTVPPLAGGDIADLEEYERAEIERAGLPEGVVRRLIAAYGTGYTAVTATMKAHAHLAAPLSPACGVSGAEILHAIRSEMAVHLTDALLRRTAAGTAGHPGREAVSAAAAIMADALSWSPARTADEIAAVDAFYQVT